MCRCFTDVLLCCSARVDRPQSWSRYCGTAGHHVDEPNNRPDITKVWAPQGQGSESLRLRATLLDRHSSDSSLVRPSVIPQSHSTERSETGIFIPVRGSFTLLCCPRTPCPASPIGIVAYALALGSHRMRVLISVCSRRISDPRLRGSATPKTSKRRETTASSRACLLSSTGPSQQRRWSRATNLHVGSRPRLAVARGWSAPFRFHFRLDLPHSFCTPSRTS